MLYFSLQLRAKRSSPITVDGYAIVDRDNNPAIGSILKSVYKRFSVTGTSAAWHGHQTPQESLGGFLRWDSHTDFTFSLAFQQPKVLLTINHKHGLKSYFSCLAGGDVNNSTQTFMKWKCTCCDSQKPYFQLCWSQRASTLTLSVLISQHSLFKCNHLLNESLHIINYMTNQASM